MFCNPGVTPYSPISMIILSPGWEENAVAPVTRAECILVAADAISGYSVLVE
jgi:hypothetical protein